jgi:type III secretory pathway lipoprotein EscJ
VKRLVSAAVPDLSPDAVTVVEVSVPKTAATLDVVRLGPVSATKAAARRVRWFVGAIAAANFALVACLVTVWLRLRKFRPKPNETGGALAREAR